MEKKFCDICGAEIPTVETVAAMKHNDAANTRWGTWCFQSGVLSYGCDDVCADCGLQINDYINKLKEEKKVAVT